MLLNREGPKRARYQSTVGSVKPKLMPTNCPYCRTVNDASENRCARCGRRLHPTAAQPAPQLTSRGPSSLGVAGGAAAARAFDQEPAPRNTPPAAAPPLAQPAPQAGEYQPSLFRDLPGGPKVVPIPMLSPMRPASPLDRESVRRNAARSAARTPRPTHESQQMLDLQARSAASRPARPEETLYCDARVALPTHRSLAAALDGAFVLSGTLLFLVLVYLGGVDFSIMSNLLILPAAITAIVVVLYRGMWCLANRDTPGMRYAGLRLVDFDGRAPRRERRIVRQFAGLLSLLSAGVGLVWALVDEENLTWHDHISKTFPTTV